MVETLEVSAYLTKLKEIPAPQILDIRTSLEYELGHLDGATSCSILDWNFNRKISKLNKSLPVFIYCETAHRSPLAARRLQRAGFQKIYDLAGGYRKYRKYRRSKAAKD